MIEGGNFNIQSTLKPTNNDLVVVFSPAINTVKYTYTIYKDKTIVETKTIDKNENANIYLNQTGSYQITVKTYDSQNKESTINSGIYTIDKVAPVITINKENIKINKNDHLPNDIVTATDNYSGDLTNQITTSEIDTSTSGEKTLTFTVIDEAGNTATKDLQLTVNSSNLYLPIIQTTFLILIIFIVYLIARFQKALNLSKRIEPFTIDPKVRKTPSLIDRIITNYQTSLKKIEPKLNKSIIAAKYSKYLDKYVSVSNIHQTGTQIFISKIIIAFLFILIAIFTKAMQFKLISSYELALPLLVGFFLLDIVYFIKYKAYQNKLENDLLSAIIIMNNAFKSGRSITQAIDIVSHEMTGKIASEFAKMSLELSYGLEIDTVFKRFGERIKLEEVNYLTASLTILNKTGGNIIEVFTSIERTLFNKKKLRLELKSLTASSKIIVYTLFIVPFLFILFVSIISPDYFMPFITTNIGRILLIIMIIYYLVFIYSVRKIMKVVI